jgi:hypothetical protein
MIVVGSTKSDKVSDKSQDKTQRACRMGGVRPFFCTRKKRKRNIYVSPSSSSVRHQRTSVINVRPSSTYVRHQRTSVINVRQSSTSVGDQRPSVIIVFPASLSVRHHRPSGIIVRPASSSVRHHRPYVINDLSVFNDLSDAKLPHTSQLVQRHKPCDVTALPRHDDAARNDGQRYQAEFPRHATVSAPEDYAYAKMVWTIIGVELCVNYQQTKQTQSNYTPTNKFMHFFMVSTLSLGLLFR